MPVALGARVLARFRGGEQEFPGTISACYNDGSYAIDYDDGTIGNTICPLCCSSIHPWLRARQHILLLLFCAIENAHNRQSPANSFYFFPGDSEDRVDYAFIRKIPAAAAGPAAAPNGTTGSGAAQRAQVMEENAMLRGQIKQMIALSQEEDAETENLVQSMSASLSEARRANEEKDSEILKMRKALTDAKKQAKSQVDGGGLKK